MEVDVVSMSWSFELKLERSDHERFKTIVRRIVQARKHILVASLPDENSATKTSTYVPVELSGVIPISSATVYGRMIEENMFANPEFLLPGEDVHVDGMKTPVKGSSYATAYAAGLAALVLYFLSVHHKLEASDDEGVPGKEKLRERRLEKARTTDGMRLIFRALSRELGTSEKKLFVRPARVSTASRKISPSQRKKREGRWIS